MGKKRKFDFAGWATRFNVKCSDGRVIKPEAFEHSDGLKVPLVWNHNHGDIKNVLGHAMLEKRPEGIYAYGYLNDTPDAQAAKSQIYHGDITSLSIYANKLKQKGSDVVHGIIREVSLVLAGANPGAHIDMVMSHNDEDEGEATIFNASESLELMHSDNPKKPKKEEKDEDDEDVDEDVDDENVDKNPEDGEGGDEDPEEDDEEVKKAKKLKEEALKHKDEPEKDKEKKPMAEKTVKDVFDELTEEQKNVVYAMIGAALEEKGEGDDEDMKQNAFDKTNPGNDEDNFLSHAEFTEIMKVAKRDGSVKEAFLAHDIDDISLAHSITNVGNLFPEARALQAMPETINENQEWVGAIMGAVKKSPFSRIKTMVIDITGEDARAKGYVKGEQKVAEVILALKRTTTPTTIYKLQKMDRDDILDITDFDVLAYLKQEMRLKLNEEIARAILLGDGRDALDADKIDAGNLRPILGDNAVYAVPKIVTREAGVSDSVFAKAFIKEVIKSRKDYKGSGNPTFFTTEDMLTNMLLIEDTNGRVIYDTVDRLKLALRVKDIVTVIPMEDVVRTDETETYDYLPLGILVNLADYNVGADKGGEVNFFDNFDLNFNKQEYLIETRISGALIKPYSAITFELKRAHVAG